MKKKFNEIGIAGNTKKKKKKIVASFIHTHSFSFSLVYFLTIMEITSIRWKSVGRWICIFYIQLRLQKLNVQTVYKFEGTEYRLSDLRPTFWSRDKLAIFFEFFIFFFFRSKRTFHSIDETFGLGRISRIRQTICNLFFFF